MNLLQIVQQAMQELGLASPNAVASSSDTTVLQFKALLNGLGQDLVKAHDWQVLQKEHTFNTASGTASYALPSDFDRILDSTQWDRANAWPMSGPKTPQQWQEYKSGIVTSAGIHKRFRIKGNLFYIDPTPTATEASVFEYIQDTWATDVLGTTYKTTMDTDTDIPLLDDRLLVKGLKYYFYDAKGFDSASLYDAFNKMYSAVTGHDGGAPVLSMDGCKLDRLSVNYPETNYGA